MMESVINSPYRGLTPYTEADAAYFFGRTAEIGAITANLEVARLTLLYGPSGVGKTSVLRAGVLHGLQQQARANQIVLGRPEVIPVYFSGWQGEPLLGLTQQIYATTFQLYQGAPNVPDLLVGPMPPLLTLLAQIGEQTESDLLIILDQFEEYFLYHPNESGPGSFAHHFIQAVNSSHLRANFLLSLREDALARLDYFKGRIPSLLDNRLSIGHLDRTAGHEAVVKPLERFNQDQQTTYTIEPPLVTAVLDQVGSGQVTLSKQGAGGRSEAGTDRIEAPYLQLVLTRLWQQEQENSAQRLRLTTLNDQLGGAATIVRNYLDDTLNALDPDDRDLAARFFDRLVTPSGAKIALSLAELAHYADSPETAIEAILQQLQDRRLLRGVQAPGGVTQYEIFHDVLGPALLDWQERYQKAKVAAQQLVEEQAARDKAEHQAAVERRTNRKLRMLLAMVVVFLGATIVAMFFAYQANSVAKARRLEAEARQTEAEHQAKLATSRQLAIQGREKLTEANFLDGALLAVRAGTTWPTQEAFDTLHRTQVYTGKLLATFRHKSIVSGAVWSKDERHILTWSYDHTAGIWDAVSGERLATLRHEGSINGAMWSRDEQRILTWSSDNTVGVWDAGSSRRLLTLRSENGDAVVRGAIWSKDEQRILTWSSDNTVGVWDANSGERLLILHHEDGFMGVMGAVWSKTEQQILTWSGDKTAGVWNAVSGERLLTLRHEDRVMGAMWGKDEHHILTWSFDSTVGVWDATSGERLLTLRHEAGVWGATWSKDEQRILTWSNQGTAGIWDAISGVRLATLRHEAGVWGATWSKDEQRILTWSKYDNTAGIWDAISGVRLATLRHDGNGIGPMGSGFGVIGAMWSSDEQRILTWSDDNTAGVWDATSNDQFSRLHRESYVDGAVWSKDEQRVLTWSYDNTAEVWDAIGGVQLLTLHHNDYIIDAMWSRDEKRILTWSYDNTARVWDAMSGLQLLILRYNGIVNGAIWSKDEQRILTWGTSGIAVWDAISGERLVTFHDGIVNGARWSKDEQRILTWDTGDAKVWDAVSGARLLTLRHNDFVDGAMWSGDEQRILTWSGDNTAGVWDAVSGARLLTLHHADFVYGAIWSRDKQRILTWSADNSAVVWDAVSGERLATLHHEGRFFRVRGARWSKDEQRILTWSEDNTVAVWNVASGERLVTLRHDSRVLGVNGAVWSKDEKRILTWSGEAVRQWTVSMPELLTEVCELIPRNFTEDEWHTYFGNTPYQAICPAYTYYLGVAKWVAIAGNVPHAEELFTRAVSIAQNQDGVTLDINPHAEAIRYALPRLAAQANAAALACQVSEATDLYRQILGLNPTFFEQEPKAVAAALAQQAGCK